MTKKRTITFSPSAYRHWSAIFSQVANLMWVGEFRKQFGWGISDTCFVWDGQVSTMYRDPQEHLIDLYHHFIPILENDPDFIDTLIQNLEKEAFELNQYYQSLDQKQLSKLSWEELSNQFETYLAKAIHSGPKLFVSMYIPQSVEFMGISNHKFEKEIQKLIKIRGNIDHIIGPMGNENAEKFAHAILKKSGLDIDLNKFISIEQCQNLLACQGKLETKAKNDLIRLLQKRSKYYLMGDAKILDISIEQYLEDKGWKLEKFDLNTNQLKGQVAYQVAALVKGKVCLVINKEQINKIKQGDIVVAPMTTPEYNVAIKKALAIVTDEGGYQPCVHYCPRI